MSDFKSIVSVILGGPRIMFVTTGLLVTTAILLLAFDLHWMFALAGGFFSGGVIWIVYDWAKERFRQNQFASDRIPECPSCHKKMKQVSTRPHEATKDDIWIGDYTREGWVDCVYSCATKNCGFKTAVIRTIRV